MKKFSIFLLIIATFLGPLCFFGHSALAKILSKAEEKVVQGRKVQFIRNIYAVDKEGQPDKKGLPKGIAVDGEGKLFVIFINRYEVQVFDADGKFLYRFGKKGSKEGAFLSPISIEVADNGMVFVLDGAKKKILAFSNKGEFQYEFSFMNRRRSPADKHTMRCTKIGMDRQNGILYLPDNANDNIKLFDLKGKSLGLYPLKKKFVPSKPYFDSRGNAYFPDMSNGKVHIYNAKKEFLYSFGSLGDRLGNFARPIAVCVNPQSNIYVLDRLLSVIQILYPDGRVLGVIKDTEYPDGLKSIEPFDMVMDYAGTLYVSSQSFHCIKVLKD